MRLRLFLGLCCGPYAGVSEGARGGGGAVGEMALAATAVALAWGAILLVALALTSEESASASCRFSRASCHSCSAFTTTAYIPDTTKSNHLSAVALNDPCRGTHNWNTQDINMHPSNSPRLAHSHTRSPQQESLTTFHDSISPRRRLP